MQLPWTHNLPLVQRWHGWLLVVALLGSAPPTWAQQSAAKVMAVAGSAKAIDPQGHERALGKGADLYAGDKIVTADGALVQMRLNDGGYMSVRAGTELVIDRFVHDEKNASNSSFLVSLLRGGFRSITGLIGHTNPSGYQIRSATATVGIRGTDHEPMVILDTPGMRALGAPGLYDKVNDGETFITNKGGVLSLKRGDVGFAPLTSDTPPQVLLKVPDFYKLDVKTDARESKDDANDKSDGNKRANPGGGLLRPSVAARREAMEAGADGRAMPAIQTPTDRPIAPATLEQKRAIILQGVAAPKPGPAPTPLTK